MSLGVPRCPHATRSSVRGRPSVRPGRGRQGTKKQQERHGRQSRADKRTGGSEGGGLDSQSELRTTFTVHPSMRRRRRRRRRRHDSQARRRHFPTASGQKTHTKERGRAEAVTRGDHFGSAKGMNGRDASEWALLSLSTAQVSSTCTKAPQSTLLLPPLRPSVGPPRWRR